MNCPCEQEGFCAILGREMRGRVFQLCKTDPRYRRIFRRQAGLPEYQHNSPRVPCVHAGCDLGHVSTPMGLLPILECGIHLETSPPICDFCEDRCQRKTTSTRLENILPIIGKGPRIQKWAVGMVTAPRQETTFEKSIRSMIHAGWTSPRIFAEPNAPIPSDLKHLPITQHDTVANAWGNWYLGLHELLAREPNADAYMIAQDDVNFTPGDSQENLRQYLERALWPEDSPGFVSLYCSSAYSRANHGWHKLEKAWVWGACAIIFPRESLRHFLATKALDWTTQGRNRKIDIAVGLWQKEYKRSAWFCSPSLTQHTGHTSTIWSRRNKAAGKRAAREFVGDML